ncbi:MAG: OprO/OprP family phosphate-selective porin [Myxococcota bacterium]
MRLRYLTSIAIALIVGSTPALAAESYDLLSGDNATLDISTNRGLRLRFEEPQIELRLGGRFHGDLAFFDDDASSIDNDAQVRRGRAYIAGRLFEDWKFKFEREFSDERSGWRNLWLRYEPFDRTWIKVGNFVAPFGLEDVASSNHATFMERALSSALSPSFGTGVAVHHRGRLGDTKRRNHWTATGAFTVEPLNDRQDDLQHRSNHWALTSRVTFAPVAERRRVFHLAGSFEYRNVDGGSNYRVRTRPESGMAPPFLSTGLLPDVDQTIAFGVEAATVLGPFSAQAEYMRMKLERDTRSDPVFDGWYVQATYLVTGESRRYSTGTGTFRGVRPKGKWGALELAARYSMLDLVDETVTGGRAKNFTAGVNWYLCENLRLMFNWVHVDARRSDGQSDNPDIFQSRLMFFF